MNIKDLQLLSDNYIIRKVEELEKGMGWKRKDMEDGRQN